MKYYVHNYTARNNDNYLIFLSYQPIPWGRERERDRNRDRETEKERKRQRHKQRHRDSDRDRQTAR